MELRAFPVLHAQDVERVAAFYGRVGFSETTIHREPADMPWGERIAFLADPEGNLVTLAQSAT
jgi:uncharacterized glyoxalase superfamily protein PhnB